MSRSENLCAVEELWIYTADSGNVLISSSLNDFFRSRSGDFVSLEVAHTEFWLDVLGDDDAPQQDVLDTRFHKRMKRFAANKHAATFHYLSGYPATLAFSLFTVNGFSPNIPRLIFCVTSSEDSVNGAWTTSVSSARAIGDLNRARVTDGYVWDRTYAGGPLTDAYELYSFDHGVYQLVLMALESEIQYEVTTGGHSYFVRTLVLSADETCSWEDSPVIVESPDPDACYPLTQYPSLDHGGRSLPETFGLSADGEELYFQSTVLTRG